MGDFEGEFETMYATAYKTAFRLLGDRSEAEDVAQEAMARGFNVWSRIEGYAPAWVARVSMNLALDRWRRSRRRLATPVAETPGADARVAERLDLHRALASLPKRQRQVVILRYLTDLSEADVSRTLGCSVGAVKQHAHRGLERLREELDERAPAEQS